MVRILQLEDDKEIAQAMLRARKALAWEWEVAHSLEEASYKARNHKYDAILVDLEVFDAGLRKLDAGYRFIWRLANGELGSLNLKTFVIVHTAHLHQYATDRVYRIPTVAAVVQKPEDPIRYVIEIVYSLSSDRVLVEAYPLTQSADLQEAMVHLPQWKPGFHFGVPLVNFDPACLDLLVKTHTPIHFSGLAHLGADSLEELGLHEIRTIE